MDELRATSESGSQSGSVAKTLVEFRKRPLPSTREPSVTLTSFVASLPIVLDLLTGVLLGLLARWRRMERWRLLKLELTKDKIDLKNGR